MDIRGILRGYQSNKSDLIGIELSVLNQLGAIFSQYSRSTLSAVVRYQSSFTPSDLNLLQLCIDFILDNDHLLSDDNEIINLRYEDEAKTTAITEKLTDNLKDVELVNLRETDVVDSKLATLRPPPPIIKSVRTSSQPEIDVIDSKLATLRPPPPIIKSVRTSSQPETDWNYTLSSAERAFAMLENIPDYNENNNQPTSSVINSDIVYNISPIDIPRQRKCVKEICNHEMLPTLGQKEKTPTTSVQFKSSNNVTVKNLNGNLKVNELYPHDNVTPLSPPRDISKTKPVVSSSNYFKPSQTISEKKTSGCPTSTRNIVGYNFNNCAIQNSMQNSVSLIYHGNKHKPKVTQPVTEEIIKQKACFERSRRYSAPSQREANQICDKSETRKPKVSKYKSTSQVLTTTSIPGVNSTQQLSKYSPHSQQIENNNSKTHPDRNASFSDFVNKLVHEAKFSPVKSGPAANKYILPPPSSQALGQLPSTLIPETSVNNVTGINLQTYTTVSGSGLDTKRSLNTVLSPVRHTISAPATQTVIIAQTSPPTPASHGPLLQVVATSPTTRTSFVHQSIQPISSGLSVPPVVPAAKSPAVSQGIISSATGINSEVNSFKLKSVNSTTYNVQSANTVNMINSSAVSIEKVTETSKMTSNNRQRTQVLQLFPNAHPDYIDVLLKAQTGVTVVNDVCSYLIDNPNYPKLHLNTDTIVISPEKESSPQVNYYTDYKKKGQINSAYWREVHLQLSNDFRIIAMKDILAVAECFYNFYAPSHKALSKAIQVAIEEHGGEYSQKALWFPKLIENIKVVISGEGSNNEDKTLTCKILRSQRAIRYMSSIPLELKKELDFVKFMNAKEKLNADAELARKLNEDQYEEAGESIECGCCFGQSPFEEMVQCYEGHLFCKSCLQSYVREAIFGSGKLDLSCMTDDCDSRFPESQLQCCLTTDVLEKYQDRVREENLNLAELEDLVRCPSCDYAAILDSGDKVFRCQNIHCLKETCRFCKEEWKDHIGIPCEELEKKDETTLRKEYEEKMTAAKVRTCQTCKSQFMKEEGCNKMTCRCGGTMCYVCRKSAISYEHFCRHPRDPGHDCKSCKACSLWSNPEEDDKRAVLEIQQEAHKIRKEKGYSDDKMIGAPEEATEPPAKKARHS